MLQSPPQSNIVYPESDGKPMADNMLQFRWIVTIKENLELLYANDDRVFVAGDLLWYPIEGNNSLCQAPDALVVFGRPKGDRRSYQQWKENNLLPQVAFEILSPSNRLKEMTKKFKFYDDYGIEEYYIYAPDNVDLTGWIRSEGQFQVIEDLNGWTSPRLGIRFELQPETLELYRPDGDRFLTFVELGQAKAKLEQQLDQERQRADRLAERLRALGIDPDAE
ncbi:MAG: Uma2 family endonuclease [Plectolyngbya sp. WJT66-NPBG17]|jgi:Uma2 family endonuclease|nr:Uma2 family endonuclease [Plectolyngbya sp. WJT66-NPBG17]MBW4526287.1 Uma2 family endonuclease [Phormidium tanganyikae FI6-MK23]